MRRGDTITVPAGQYFLGDPCYSIVNPKWNHVLDATDCLDEGSYKEGIHTLIAFSTAYGDGRYDDQFGNEYPVDAGMIGLVPVEIANVENPTGVQRVTFTEPTVCHEDDGILTFGRYIIDTDPSAREPYDDGYDDDEEDDEELDVEEEDEEEDEE